MTSMSGDDITPSHPSFDRSSLTDQEYIERLLFEIKELKSTLVRKDQLIQSLQGNFNVKDADTNDDPSKKDDIPERSSRRIRKEPKLDTSATEEEVPLETSVLTSKSDVSNSKSDKSHIKSTQDALEITKSNIPASEPHMAKDISINSLQPSDLSIDSVSASTSLDHHLQNEAPSNRSSIYSDDENKKLNASQDKDLPGLPEDSTPVLSNDSTVHQDSIDKSVLEYNKPADSEPVLEEGLSELSISQSKGAEEESDSLHLTKSVDTQGSGNGMFQHMNHSSSSFQSYRSRIKLPSTLQQQAQVKAAHLQSSASNSLSPVAPSSTQLKALSHQYTNSPQSPVIHSIPQPAHTPTQNSMSPHLQGHISAHPSPQLSNEPPRIPLPESPEKNKTNVLSPKGLTHSKTFKDLNIQNLRVNVPPASGNSLDSLRSPAVLYQDTTYNTPTINTGHTGEQSPEINSKQPLVEYREVPHTPEGFYERPSGSKGNLRAPFEGSVSNISSPSIPMHAQASPSTRNSSKGAFEYESDTLRTPITSEFMPQDAMYNLRNASGSTRNISNRSAGLNFAANDSSFLVNRTVVNEDDVSLFIKPDEFQSITINVLSTICPANSQGQASASLKKLDETYITIAIRDRSSNKEMWRIKKSLTQLVAFDNEIRPTIEYFGLPVLPDKALFFSTTPNKIDIRINGLQNYFNTLFVMPHIPHLILFRICKYLSLDFINPLDEFKSGARKEGYLVRRYKGLGTSWKIRWCQVDGPMLELYDTPGGSLLEHINLHNCQIGRQSNDSVAEDKGYRHAFLIMEGTKTSKLSNSLPKHFFCAESDSERDEWVDSLIEMSGFDSSSTSAATSIKEDSSGHLNSLITPRNYGSEYQDDLDSSYSNYRQYKSPVLTMSYQTTETEKSDAKEKNLDKKGKKRSIFPFRKNPSGSNASQGPMFDQNNLDSELNNTIISPNANASFNSNLSVTNSQGAAGVEDSSIQLYLDKMGLDEQMSKQIFGREISQAFEISHHAFLGREIPSICYRCIEFLLKTGAVYEEGIFRLSGSASTIRQLKEAFNKKFDIDLFTHELKPDIHTVAGLFKTYLRELPSPIISDKCYSEIRRIVTERGNSSASALMIKDYLNNPQNISKIHYDSSYIIFKFLKEIINNRDSNKMNLRNVCIVFVPTLNISLDVLSLILVDFNCIFEGDDPVLDSERETLDLSIPNF